MFERFASLTTILLAATLFTTPSFAQEKGPRPSPSAKAACSFADGKSVTVDYSSPRAKGRKIYGGLVPYGEVWRAGANEATTFVTDTDVVVGGKTIPAGAYTIFTIPNENKWTFIISKKTKNAKGGPLWGIPYPGEGDDLTRVDMKVSKLPSNVENFTISFDKTASGCSMNLDWETTRASIDISEKK